MAERVGDFIQTYTGVHFYPLDPRPEDFRIEDIAHALSNLCRYTGHGSRFYSVGEHSVHVSRLCPPGLELQGLLHDGAEAYVGDMSSPLKHDRAMDGYFVIEARVQFRLTRAFGLPYPTDPAVKKVDQAMLWWESQEFMKPDPCWERWRELGEEVRQPHSFRIGNAGWHPEVAELVFMRRYKELTSGNDSARGAVPIEEKPTGALAEQPDRAGSQVTGANGRPGVAGAFTVDGGATGTPDDALAVRHP